jgi:aminoglycoside 3-N-acetyltransferase
MPSDALVERVRSPDTAPVSKAEFVEGTDRPATVGSIRDELGRLGLTPGVTVIVHSSLSRLGYVVGGAQTVVTALVELVGPSGTLVMPTHSGDLSDPARWRNPPVPTDWWPVIRAEMPAFDPDLTPTRLMGAIVECFRHLPGVRRSSHPAVSFAALGPNTSEVVDGHELAYGFGERSPLARLYELDAFVLLLGVTHASNTSLHLAEYRADYPGKTWRTEAAPLIVDGERRWVEYPDLEADDSDFEPLGVDFGHSGAERRGPVGAGRAALMRQRAVVDYAVGWFERNRKSQQ